MNKGADAMSKRPFRTLSILIGVLAMLTLASLACNAAGNQADSAATVQVFYITITAQAGTPLVPTQVGEIASLAPSLAATPTSLITPTAPASRSGNGSNLVIAQCANDVAIDGSDADWTSQSGVIGVSLNQNTYGASEWSGPNDLSGYARLCWNSGGLYFFVDVTDDVHVQEQRGETSWKGDEVEILLDADLRGDFYNTAWNNDDYQVGLNPGNFADLPPAPYRYHPTIGLPQGVAMSASSVGTAGNYKVEAKLSLSTEAGIQVAAGQTFGMCVALSDNDHAGTAQQDSMVSHCSHLRVSDPTTWVTVTLQ
jgi:hypothetical protein